jgi:hypothetical protein
MLKLQSAGGQDTQRLKRRQIFVLARELLLYYVSHSYGLNRREANKKYSAEEQEW